MCERCDELEKFNRADERITSAMQAVRMLPINKSVRKFMGNTLFHLRDAINKIQEGSS